MLLQTSLLVAGAAAADITNFVLDAFPKAFGNTDCSKKPYLTLKNPRIALGECVNIDDQLGLDSILTCTENGVLDWKKFKSGTDCQTPLTNGLCSGEGNTCDEVITNKKCFLTQPRPTYSSWTWEGACTEGGDVKPECMCPKGRRLLINPDLFMCEEEGYELVPKETEKECEGGKTITCQGPGHVCKNDDGEFMDAVEKVVQECRCPMGRRRLAINPDHFTCKPHGGSFVLKLEKSTHECDSGDKISCDGPGYECVNKRGVVKEPAEVDPKDRDNNGNTKCVSCGSLCIVEDDIAGTCDKDLKCQTDVNTFDKIKESCKTTKCEHCAQDCVTEKGEEGFCNPQMECTTGEFNFFECNGPDTDCSKEKCGTFCIKEGDLAGQCDAKGNCELDTNLFDDETFCQPPDTDCSKEKCGAFCITQGDIAGKCDSNGKCEMNVDVFEDESFCDGEIRIGFEGIYDNYVSWCGSMKTKDDCKACVGKFKKKKCTPSKSNKLKCKKAKSEDFCKDLKCKYNEKRNKCSGKHGLK